MKQVNISLSVDPSHVAALLNAVNETGIAAVITMGGAVPPLADRSVVPMDDSDQEAADVVASRRTVKRARKQVAARVAYVANIGTKRGQSTRAELKKADLSPARRKVLDDILAAGSGGVVDGFDGISKRTRLNPKTVDGSVYYLRHAGMVVSQERE